MDRKQFLINTMRGAAAAGLVLGAGRLCAGREGCALTAAECAGCTSLPDCSLPQAAQARRAQTPPPGNHK